jgi:hypothetical protein
MFTITTTTFKKSDVKKNYHYHFYIFFDATFSKSGKVAKRQSGKVTKNEIKKRRNTRYL